jgi:hypothetical protein
MSSVKHRGRYKSEKRASLTLRELEAWLTLEIGGRNHSDIHRGIQRDTPHGVEPCVRRPTNPGGLRDWLERVQADICCAEVGDRPAGACDGGVLLVETVSAKALIEAFTGTGQPTPIPWP